jgi:hypothetical protein
MRGSKMTLDLDINQEEVGFKLRQNTNTEDAGEQRRKKKRKHSRLGIVCLERGCVCRKQNWRVREEERCFLGCQA